MQHYLDSLLDEAIQHETSKEQEKNTYINSNSTFFKSKLEYGNLVISKDRLAVRIVRNNKLCGVHRDRWRVVTNFKDKLLVCSALYK